MSAESFEDVLSRLLTISTRATTVALALGLAATFLFPDSAATRGLLTAGLAILLLTPVARVIVTVIGYARQRDWVFVLCSAIVLVLLMASLVAALG